MAIQAVQLRKGMIIELDGELLRVHDFQHVTPGKGQAIVQTRMRNLRSGSMIDKRFRSQEAVERVQLDSQGMEYLYQEGDSYVFMNSETYEQTHLSADAIEEALPYLVANLSLKVDFYQGLPVSIEMPTTVDLEVTDTEPGLKGATASASSKPATLETGLVVGVPQFVNIGDRVRVETSTGEYLTRV
ncbi:MAG: elongation factor P [Acidobacteria bacterium]|nr:elongation factor P [Acidobacteriota bacterium]